MTTAIAMENLTRRFPRSAGYRSLFHGLTRQRQYITAVDGVNLKVGQGELFGLLGPNGAGKTTLMKLLCTLILPSSGRASVFGHDVVREDRMVKKLVSLVTSDERTFYWRLTGRENLEFYAALWGLSGKGLREKVDGLLRMVGLGDEADRRFQGYSSGMRQKLAIARGLLGAPRVLLVDEPTRSLDPVSAKAVRQLIREQVAAAGMTVVLATHHLGEAEELCSRLAIMDRGKVLACGAPWQLRQNLSHRETFQLQIGTPRPEVLARLHDIPSVAAWRILGPQNGHCTLELDLRHEGILPQAVRGLVECGVDIYSCHVAERPLEEVFLATVGQGGNPL